MEKTPSGPPLLTPEMKVEFDLDGASGTEGSDLVSSEAKAAMLNDYCRACGKFFEKNAWNEERKFCSRECRKNRNKSLLEYPMGPEEAVPGAGEALKIRAWHKPLQLMCNVVALDYAANRVYARVFGSNYPFNALMHEFVLQTNIGFFKNRVGADITEGDVIRYAPEGTEGFIGSIIYAKEPELNGLFLREIPHTPGEDIRRIPVTEESALDMQIIGDIFTYVPEKQI